MSTETRELTQNELAVLESLHGESKAISQREIAKRTGLSVGLINAVIKKLVHTGYVKTSHLNRRSLDYLLTPQGFAQTAMRSYRYVLNTLRSYREMQERLSGLIEKLKAEGVSDFYLHGDGEFADTVAAFFEEGESGNLYRGLPRSPDKKSVVLNAMPEPADGNEHRVIDLVQELGNGKAF